MRPRARVCVSSSVRVWICTIDRSPAYPKLQCRPKPAIIITIMITTITKKKYIYISIWRNEKKKKENRKRIKKKEKKKKNNNIAQVPWRERERAYPNLFFCVVVVVVACVKCVRACVRVVFAS